MNENEGDASASNAGTSTARAHLSKKQREQLHQAMLEYLKTMGFAKTFDALKEETNIEEDAKVEGLLEKKWTSVIRLQKKILDLEAKNKALMDEVNQNGGGPGKKKDGDEMPRPPAKYTLTGHRNNVNAIKFHPVFALLASASEDATIKVWDYETGEFERTLKGHTLAVQDLAFDHTGKILASCSADTTVKVWDFQAYKCIKTLHGHDHNVSSVIFTPSGDHIISASRDKSIKFWEVSTGYCIKTINAHEEWVKRVIINDDATIFATSSYDQTIKIWSNGAKVECTEVLRGHSHVVECIAFSPPSTPILGVDEASDGGRKK